VHPALTGWRLGAATLLTLLVLGTLLTRSVLFVDGSSMMPTLQPNQLLLLNRAAYLGWDRDGPRRGDVVVFRRQVAGRDHYLVKRVIGVPGDLVLIDTGRVYVNGARLDEPYVLNSDDYSYSDDGRPVRVPDRAYFVLGDNRPASTDSHLGWFVPTDDLVGQAWPLALALPVPPALATP
jgi:signal peptidase I